jgi:hypothetical protein
MPWDADGAACTGERGWSLGPRGVGSQHPALRCIPGTPAVTTVIKASEASIVDHQARTALRSAIVDYMRGATRSFAFQDAYEALERSSDDDVRRIVEVVYCFHDDFIDHPISVSRQRWDALRRAVAFLGTEQQGVAERTADSWPFADEASWRAHEHLLDSLALPDYSEAVHGRRVRPAWHTVPTWLGVLVMVAVVVMGFVALEFL